jgi:hypothetical protein
VTPSTSWKEVVPEDEDTRFLRYAEQLRELQRQRAKGGRASRGLHAKAVANVKAELEVLGDLPEPARAGLFEKPGKYRAYVRFSNGSGTRQPDSKGDVRGVAIKVLGVPGKKVIPGLEQAKTQDFLLIHTPSSPFRNADEFMGVVLAVGGNPLLTLPRIIGLLGPARAFQVLKRFARGTSTPLGSVATTRYFSGVPIRYGDYAVHYALEPEAKAGLQGAGSAADYLGEELAARLRREPLVYDLRVQFYSDAARTPLEDASVEWTEANAPFVTVAKLSLPIQDLASTDALALSAYIETLSFDPWHALEAHRPLGNIMRARNHAYRLSTAERKAAPEPEGSDWAEPKL